MNKMTVFLVVNYALFIYAIAAKSTCALVLLAILMVLYSIINR